MAASADMPIAIAIEMLAAQVADVPACTAGSAASDQRRATAAGTTRQAPRTVAADIGKHRTRPALRLVVRSAEHSGTPVTNNVKAPARTTRVPRSTAWAR